MPGTVYKRQEADIMSQTTIFLYTDGLNEAEDIHHTQFGIQRLQQLAESMLANGENEPSKIITKMEDAVRSFVAGAEQSDDLTMLAIKWMKDE
jgi:sigma-B regulation protein RsbU (phosphoserine phosphatase)